jgi:hypothetical protein
MASMEGLMWHIRLRPSFFQAASRTLAAALMGARSTLRFVD